MRYKNVTTVWLLCLAVGANCTAAESVTYQCAGRVSDTRGAVVPGANISFYATTYGPSGADYILTRIGETATDANGVFIFAFQPGTQFFSPYATILASKEGLAVGWHRWKLDEYVGVSITLGEPAATSGIVVDGSGRPVDGAEVSVSMLFVDNEPYRRDFADLEYGAVFTAQTDSRGVFVFDYLPANTRMEFKVSKTGFALLDTTNKILPVSQRGQFRAGQRNIRVMMSPGGAITGVVVDEANRPVGGVTLVLMTWYHRDILDRPPVTTRHDGTFTIEGVAFGSYLLGMPEVRSRVADWVFDQVELKVDAYDPEANVVVRANRGGLVQFVVTEDRSAQPVADAGILLADARTARPFFCRSGSDGTAVIRLPAATYSITSVSSDKGKPYPGQDFVKVPPGAEVRKEIKLFDFPSVAGVAVDRQGAPIAGASVQTLPKGQLTLLSGAQKGYELTRTETLLAGIPVVFTDPEGKFEAIWYLDELEKRQIREKYIVLRDVERDLAAAVQVDNTKGPLTVEMTPGVTVTGRVVDSDGREVAHGRMTLYMVVPGWRLVIGELLTQVSETGEFRISALPRGRSFALDVGAAGYGVRDVRFNTEAAGAILELGDIPLAQANLRISGIVVDAAGRPVPAARLTAFGCSDAVFNAVTDARGEFVLDNVPESEVVISAAVQGLINLSGAVQAKSPAQDVKIVWTMSTKK